MKAEQGKKRGDVYDGEGSKRGMLKVWMREAEVVESETQQRECEGGRQ